MLGTVKPLDDRQRPVIEAIGIVISRRVRQSSPRLLRVAGSPLWPGGLFFSWIAAARR